MIRTLKKLDEIEKIKGAWLDLWEKDPFSTIFNHPDWCLSFAKAMMPLNLLIILCEENGELKCVWPLKKNKRCISFLSAPTADYSRPSIVPGFDNAEAVQVLLESLKHESVAKIVLNEFRSDDPLPDIILSQAAPYGYKLSLEQGLPCPRMSRKKDPEILKRKFVDSKRRRRDTNRVFRVGNLQYERITSREEVLACLPEFFLLHTERWAGIGHALFVNPRVRDFYVRLVQTLPEELIYFARLKLNGQTFAMGLSFSYQGTLYLYKTAYDITKEKLSPGFLIRCHIGTDISEQGFHTLDFTRGSETWKLKFANEVVYNRQVILFANYYRKVSYNTVNKAKGLLVRNPIRSQQIKNRIAHLRAGVAKYGYAGLVRHVMGKVYRKKIRRPQFLLFEILKDKRARVNQRDDIRIRQGSIEDLFDVADLVDRVDKQRYISKLMKRIRSGDEVYLAYYGDALAHVVWVTYRKVPFPEAERDVPHKEGTAYFYDAVTSSRMRGRGIYTSILKWLVHRIFETTQCHRFVGACFSDNIPSRKGIEKAGFELKKVLTK